jgi:hypothetical protein
MGSRLDLGRLFLETFNLLLLPLVRLINIFGIKKSQSSAVSFASSFGFILSKILGGLTINSFSSSSGK